MPTARKTDGQSLSQVLGLFARLPDDDTPFSLQPPKKSKEYTAFYRNPVDADRKAYSRTGKHGAIEAFSALNYELLIKNYEANGIDDAKMDNILRFHLEHQHGIVAQDVELDGKKYRVYDARNSLPLEQRLSEDHPVFQSTNMLLRAHSTMRAIKHALTFHGQVGGQTSKAAQQQIAYLNEAFIQLLAHVSLQTPLPQKLLESYERTFNAKLIIALHQSGLAGGVKPDQFKHLLLHYRDMSAVLDPAPTEVTLNSKTLDDGSTLHHYKVAEPITQKTDKQKTSLESLQTLGRGEGESENHHNHQVAAFQFANQAFAERLAADDSRKPPQARNNIADGLNNAYFSQSACFLTDRDDKIIGTVSTQESVRFGSAVYVGEGESREQLVEKAQENFEQVKTYALNTLKFAREARIHLTMVNTGRSAKGMFDDKQETRIVKITEEAIDANRDIRSYVPINVEGISRHPVIAQEIKGSAPSYWSSLTHTQVAPEENGFQDPSQDTAELRSAKPGFFSFIARAAAYITILPAIVLTVANNTLKSLRARLAGLAHTAAMENPGVVAAVACNSGCDRTGTVDEIAENMHITKVLQANDKAMSSDEIAIFNAQGRHNARMSSAACGGSDGLKTDSIPGDYFPDVVTKQNYRATAKTNTKAKYDKKAVSEVVQKAPEKYGSLKTAVLARLLAYVDENKSRGIFTVSCFFSKKSPEIQKVNNVINIISKLDASNITDIRNALNNLPAALINDLGLQRIAGVVGTPQHQRVC